MELGPELGQLGGTVERLLAGRRRMPLQERHGELFDEPGLTLGGDLVDPEMSRLNPEGEVAHRELDHRDGLDRVLLHPSYHQRLDQAELLELG